MKILTVLAILFLVLFGVTLLTIVNASENNQSHDTTHFKVELSFPDGDHSQKALNMAAARELKRADDTLNDIYNKVLIKHEDDQEFIEKFTAAELAWIAFRDAEMEAIFPKQDKQRNYGSKFPMSYCIVKAELTWDRVKQLNQWLEGFSEGNTTAGSRWP